jgi:hydroxyacyl-ACP dehydratase HTD2-like protein with hotdog domain
MNRLLVKHVHSGLRAGLYPNSKALTSSTVSYSIRSLSTKEGTNSQNIEEWASKEAIEALNGFKKRFANSQSSNEQLPISTYYQKLDANQIHLLRITESNMLPLGLGDGKTAKGQSGLEYEAELRENEEDILTGKKAELSGILANGIAAKSIIRPAEHLVFFTPRVSSSSLGDDGSDTTFNPPGGIFTRRMWAGGKMEWLGKDKGHQIRVGDRMWERTFVEEAELKKLSNGGEMILVWVRKEFGIHKDTTLFNDRRSWIFQRALPTSSNAEPQKSAAITPKSDLSSLSPPEGLLYPTLQYQTPANLFRYSALTFNAHAIHLSPPWAQQVEGHKGIVVHGPLNLSLLVRKWGREIAGWHLNEKGEFIDANPKEKKQVLKSVDYRAKRPIYAEQPYWIGIQQSNSNEPSADNEHKHTVVAVKPDGQIIMEATITSQSKV